MAINVGYKIPRGTRANLDAKATAGTIVVGQPYLITDETRIAVGLTTTTYAAFAIEDEVTGGGPAPTFAVLTTTGTGSAQNITLGAALTADQVFVSVNGLIQVPVTDYTMSGNILTITVASGDVIMCRYLGDLPNFLNIVIEGDSITSGSPSTYDASYYSYQYDDYRTDRTINVRAQGSRIVGAVGNLNDNGNSLMGNVSEDAAYGANLITAMIGSNDMISNTDATYRGTLVDYYEELQALGIKFAWSAPIPFNPTGTPHANYTYFTTQRTSLMADARNPAVWGTWADYYLPMGEYPDFADVSLAAPLFGDTVHPSAAGQLLLYASYKAAMDTLVDNTTETSTTPAESVWPANQTNLALSTVITDRMIIKGVAHTGLASGISITGSSAQIRLNGGSWGTTIGRIYNGDIVDVKVTTSGTNDVAVTYDLTIGTETRTISKRTVIAVTDVTYTHGDIVGNNTYTTGFTTASQYWPVGLGVIFVVRGAVTSITVNGVSATKLETETGANRMELWTVPIATAGNYGAVLAFPNQNDVVVSMGTVQNADSTPTVIVKNAPASESQPHLLPSATIPASGMLLAAFHEYGVTITPATANNGTLVDEGYVTGNGESHGIALSKNTTAGATTASFNFVFGTFDRIGVVFKAFGT